MNTDFGFLTVNEELLAEALAIFNEVKNESNSKS
jgi:polyphosphate kinase